MKIKLSKIQHSSSEYFQALELRIEVLRKPLGLTYSDEDLAHEIHDHHFIATQITDRKILGYLNLRPVSDTRFKMRQVAVSPSLQGQGIGNQMVKGAEDFVRKQGAQEIELHARLTAVKFYLKLNYKLTGNVFTEVGIPHQKMTKALN